MQGVHELKNKVFISNDLNIVKAPYKTGEMAFFQLNKRAMQFDCLVLNNDKIIEKYVFYPQQKRISALNKLVEFVCKRFKPLLKDENIPALIKAISSKAIR